jgi:hypothetical protein
MASNISCPVSTVRTDGNIAKVAAILIALIVIAGLLLQSYIIFAITAFDFSFRAFTAGKLSFIRGAAIKIASVLKLNKYPVDAAPKKFAAGLGFLFSIIITVSFYSGSIALAYSAGAVLLFCALLEGLFSICLGCHVYTFLTFAAKHKSLTDN